MKKIIVRCGAIECFHNSGGLASICTRDEIYLVSKSDNLIYHKGEDLECIDYDPEPTVGQTQRRALESNQDSTEKRCERL